LKHDSRYVANLENKVKEKYGDLATSTFKPDWTQKEKEEFRQQFIKFHEKITRNQKTNKQYTINNTCPICDSFSFFKIDDLYLTKFSCCYRCYLSYLEGKEKEYLNFSEEEKSEFWQRKLIKKNLENTNV